MTMPLLLLPPYNGDINGVKAFSHSRRGEDE